MKVGLKLNEKWFMNVLFGLWMVCIENEFRGELELQWFMDENWNFVTWNCNDLNGYGIRKKNWIECMIMNVLNWFKWEKMRHSTISQ